LIFTWRDPSVRETPAVDKDQALANSAEFWAQTGVDTHQLKSSAVMDGDQLADGYLGKYKLRDQYKAHVPEQAPLVYWKVSFFPAKGGAPYVTQIDPDTGEVVAWKREADAAKRADVDETTARGLAQKALQERGIAADALQRVAQSEHLQTFESVVPESKWSVGGLKLKYSVQVAGGSVTDVTYTYRVPEEFLTWHERQERIGMILTGLSFLFSFVLTVLAFIYLFLIRQKKPWWSALGLGVLTAALFALANLNELPSLEQQFFDKGLGGVGMQYGLAIMMFVVVLLGLLVAAATYVLILTGGMLTREVDTALWTSRREGHWSGAVRAAMWRGYLLAFAWLGLQGIFYLVAEKGFGVWYENDFSLSPTNMWFPLLFPLLAWLAGIQEETTYRLFGVTFFKRYWKSSFVACLLPAMIWALGHSLYPIYPIYTRFIELSLFGLVIGYCYLWWGIETVIFAHVVFDTIQMVLPFLFGGDGVEVAIGVLYLVLPIAVGYVLSLAGVRKSRKQESTRQL
jgi:hypothetical protein